MKRKHKNQPGISRLMMLLMVLLMVLVHVTPLAAQPDANGGDPQASDVPFDGGLGLALAAGVGYGVKKIRDARKKKQEEI